MDLIVLHGPPAVGKLTIAQALASSTGLKLFHNHLVLDAITAVFDFRSPTYLRLREAIWLDVFESAAREGISLIFTFMPETSLAPGFMERVRGAVERQGGRLRLVELACSIEVQEARLDAPSRAEFAKLRSIAEMREARARGWLDYVMPPSELTLDTGAMSPGDAAAAIQAALGL
jgi:AAA domain-containing protein